MTDPTIPDWAQQPLRDGEYDVPVMFRVTGHSAEDATATARRAVEAGRGELGANHIVPMYVPPADDGLCHHPLQAIGQGITCTLGRWHRGDQHSATTDDNRYTWTSYEAPAGAGPWPPVVIVERPSDSSNQVTLYGLDPRIVEVVHIDYGAADLNDVDEFTDWATALEHTAAALPADHPAADHIRETVASEATVRNHRETPL